MKEKKKKQKPTYVTILPVLLAFITIEWGKILTGSLKN